MLNYTRTLLSTYKDEIIREYKINRDVTIIEHCTKFNLNDNLIKDNPNKFNQIKNKTSILQIRNMLCHPLGEKQEPGNENKFKKHIENIGYVYYFNKDNLVLNIVKIFADDIMNNYEDIFKINMNLKSNEFNDLFMHGLINIYNELKKCPHRTEFLKMNKNYQSKECKI